jgi:hypothetical protein
VPFSLAGKYFQVDNPPFSGQFSFTRKYPKVKPDTVITRTISIGVKVGEAMDVAFSKSVKFEVS